ncbi:MAG: DUF6691 family protein [Paracoccaceae bacterium]
MRLLTTYLIGVIFGAGIALAGMANPAKVLNFFDIIGTWDPSLILVMGGALTVTFVGYRVVLRRPGPVFAGGFSLPTSRVIDLRLLGGSALFGIGWGMTGFCPGGALPALGTGNTDVFIFCAAMLVGLMLGKAGVTALSRPGASLPFKT